MTTIGCRVNSLDNLNVTLVPPNSELATRRTQNCKKFPVFDFLGNGRDVQTTKFNISFLESSETRQRDQHARRKRVLVTRRGAVGNIKSFWTRG